MNACLRDSQILQLVFGVTLETELEEVMEHLNACPACRERVESERALHSSAPKHQAENGSTTSREGDSDASPPEMLPTVEGYEILSRIHAGAQGIVYKAIQLSTSRTVAVKLLPHEHSATDRQKHRFVREVGLAASLRHPNIVTVYDSGLTSGRYFFAMEYIHGKPLDQYLKSAELGVWDKLRLFQTICSAVSYAHQKGVIHRDLKPGNILVDAASQPHVVDFGLAKSAGVMAMHGEAPFTLTSQFMGTLAYASPEQTKGDPTLIDTRSDVYALGVILYEMLTGAYPYPMTPDLAKMFQTICHTPPKPPSAAISGLSADIDTIVLRALAKEPERRYQTVADLQGDLERCLLGEPISARRDSALYLVRLRCRSLVKRHRILSGLATVFVASAMVALAQPLFAGAWNRPIKWYENWAIAWFAPSIDSPLFRDVRIIAIDDQTNLRLDEMARAAHVADVSLARPRSLRRLHGRLMEKLADTDVKVVLFDIAFGAANEELDHSFGADLARGVTALRDQGVEPVFGVDPWQTSDSQLAEELREANVEAAAVSMRQDSPGANPRVWRGVDLSVMCDRHTYLGLALTGVAQLRMKQLGLNPTQDVIHPFIDSSGGMITLEYKRTGKGVRAREVAADHFPLQQINAEDGCSVAWHQPALPAAEDIQAATLSFHDVFLADPQRLRELVDGKVLMIGDRRATASDWVTTPDGRRIVGVDLHAIAADALLRGGRSYTVIARHWYWLALTLAAGLGVLCAVQVSGALRRCLALVISLALVLTVCILLFKNYGYLLNPMLPALAMLLAMLGGMILYRGTHHSPLLATSRRSQS